jgi:hypothetical protein
MEPAMKMHVALVLAIGLSGCDFVDDDGNTGIRQVAEGLQSLGDHVAELGEAIERDADVRAVPWDLLIETVPERVDGLTRIDTEGDDTTDRNGAGVSMAHGQFVDGGDDLFVGVADLGALRSGVGLALRWAAPLLSKADVEGDIEEVTIAGRPGIRIRDEYGRGFLVALLVEGRFAVVAGAEGRGHEDFVREALAEVDYDRLEDWADYGRR